MQISVISLAKIIPSAQYFQGPNWHEWRLCYLVNHMYIWTPAVVLFISAGELFRGKHDMYWNLIHNKGGLDRSGLLSRRTLAVLCPISVWFITSVFTWKWDSPVWMNCTGNWYIRTVWKSMLDVFRNATIKFTKQKSECTGQQSRLHCLPTSPFFKSCRVPGIPGAVTCFHMYIQSWNNSANLLVY